MTKSSKNKAKKARATLQSLTTKIAQMAVATKKKTKKKKKKVMSSGPVSAISTAPVAIGNSVRGASSKVRRNGNNIIVSGRDFMFTPIGTGSVTTWTLCGGTPLSPIAFADSTIGTYLRLYGKFKWNKLCVYYITSSPTSSTGDVMFYYSKNRDSVFLNQTSSMLLPYVMTDENSVIGPQWTNHAMNVVKTSTWKSTDYGMDETLNEYSDGELFLLSKTNTTDSPGYVLFDYEIEFAEQQLQPRLLNMPIPRAQFWQLNIGETSLATTDTTTLFVASATGNNLSGNASAMPSGAAAGDIYKIIFDITNSAAGSWTNCTAANLMVAKLGGTSTAEALAVSDGYTMYAVYDGSALRAFGTCAAAYGSSPNIAFGVTATITFNIQAWISLVGTISNVGFAPSF